MKTFTVKTFLVATALFALTGVAQANIIWDAPLAGAGASSAYHTQRESAYSQRGFDGGHVLGRSDVRKLQKSLAEDGFYKGSIDGLWGGQTTQAILDYQGVNNKPLTGKLSANELREFGVHVR